LLRFKIRSGDKALERHISTAAQNATYISWNLQNQIIAAIDSIIRQTISSEVKKSRFFTLIADETMDCATQSQFSMCLRYIDMDDLHIRERFLRFPELSSMCAENISENILNILKDNDLDGNLLRGQACDGCSSMSGEFNGVQAKVKMLIQKRCMFFVFLISLNCVSLMHLQCIKFAMQLVLSPKLETFFQSFQSGQINLLGQ